MKDRRFQAILEDLDKTRRRAGGEDIPDLRGGFPHGADVTAIRKATSLSEADFARQIDVPIATLREWEQGVRWPDGPALVLLALLAKEPEIVRRTLSEGA